MTSAFPSPASSVRTRAAVAARASTSSNINDNDDDVLVAGTPTSQEHSSSDPHRDQLPDSQEDDSSQSQGNPEWLEESSPVKTPSQRQLEPKLPKETQGSLVFGEENSSDHAMYAGGETGSPPFSDTQPATPDGGWPQDVAPEPKIVSNKRQHSPSSPPTAKKQRIQRGSHSPTLRASNSDSFGSRRVAPVESGEARAERLRRERQSELAALSTAGALHRPPSQQLWDHRANSMPELPVHGPLEQQDYLSDKHPSAGSSFEETQRPLSSLELRQSTRPFHFNRSTEQLPQGHQSRPTSSQIKGSSQSPQSSALAPPAQQNTKQQDSQLTDSLGSSDEPYIPRNVLNLPTIGSSNSSPNDNQSIIPDSEGIELTQKSHVSEADTQQDDDEPPPEVAPAPVIFKLVPETTSVGTANTEVSSGTSGKRYIIPPNRALVRHKPRPDEDEAASTVDRLPVARPVSANLNTDSAARKLESAQQGTSRQTSPLKQVTAKRTETPRSESPSPKRPSRESPAAGIEEAAEVIRQPSLELPSPARPVTNTYRGATLVAKRSRASSSRMNYNEDTEEDSDDPIEEGESYRPTPVARSQRTKLKRKPSARSASSSKAGSVVPATPDSSNPMSKQHRVLGYWEPTLAWYPATIVAVEQSGWTLKFDDGSVLAGAHINEIRRLRVCPGDRVIWVKRKPVHGYVREEWTGYASTRTSLGPRIYKEVSCVTDLGEVPLRSFSIIPPKGLPPSSGLADRIIPPNLLTTFNKSPPPQSPARLASSVRPTPSLASPVKRASATSPPAIFTGVAFLITFKNTDDARMKKLRGMIESLGGVVLSEFYDLFPIPPSFNRGRDGVRVDEKARFRAAFCIVDEPSTKPKFLCALATGVPCLSWHYIQDTLNSTKKVDWRSYLVSAGWSERLGTWASQVVDREWADGYCITDLLENESVRRPLWGKRVACCLSKKDTTYYPLFPYLLSALGASSVLVANSFSELSETSNVSLVIVKDDDAVAAVQNFTGTVGTVESVKQSTITGGWHT